MNSRILGGLSLLLACQITLAGCGSSSYNADSFSDTPVIPTQGGSVALPAGSITGTLKFLAGAPVNDIITLKTSTTAPAGTPAPTGFTSDNNVVSTDVFFYITMTVSQPTPLALLSAVTLTGSVPTTGEQYNLEIDNISQANPQIIQEIPGTVSAAPAVSSSSQVQALVATDSSITFNQVEGGTTIMPGDTVVLQAKKMEEKTLTLNLQNLSEIKDSDGTPAQAYYFITGQNPDVAANDNRFYWVNEKAQLVPMDIADLDSNGLTEKYSIPFPAGGSIQLPLLRAGRIYVSVGAPIKTQLNARTLPTDPPAAWVAPNGWSLPGDPNYLTFFDFVELGYEVDPNSQSSDPNERELGMNINKTEVQMNGLALNITMTGRADGPNPTPRSIGSKPGAHQAILDGLAANPAFSSLIVNGTATGTNYTGPIRAIALNEAMANFSNRTPNVPTFDPSYYSQYIDDVWSKYKNEDLTMYTSAFGTYTGRVNTSDQMVFSKVGDSTAKQIIISKPPSVDALIGNGVLIPYDSSPRSSDYNRTVDEIASTMSAAFNRSTLLTSPFLARDTNAVPLGPKDPDPDLLSPALQTYLASFYQATTTNYYAKIIHENSLALPSAPGGAAYAFGFDDNLEQSSFIADHNTPVSVNITVLKMQ